MSGIAAFRSIGGALLPGTRRVRAWTAPASAGGSAGARGALFFAACTGALPASRTPAASSARLRLRANLTIDHHPRDRSSIIDDLVVDGVEITRDRERNQVGARAGTQHAEFAGHVERAGGVGGDRREQLGGAQPR